MFKSMSSTKAVYTLTDY